MIAAGHINLVGLIIIAAIWILSALFKRKEDTSTELPPELKARRGHSPPPPPAASNWEEELRRVLGQPAVEVPPPVFTPPARTVRRPAAPPPPLPDDMEAHIEVSLATPSPNIEPTFQPLAGLTESTQHYAQAASLQERVQQHMRSLTTHRVGSTVASSIGQQGVSPEFRELIDALHKPTGARSGIVASIIFGPPRGLEER